MKYFTGKPRTCQRRVLLLLTIIGTGLRECVMIVLEHLNLPGRKLHAM